jgi:capsular polysaccharide transport system permease protein
LAEELKPAQPRPPVKAAKIQRRHRAMLLSLVVVVVLPVVAAGTYLWTRAADQYVSRMGFTVRSEEVSSAASLLGGLSTLTGTSSSSDVDILYKFIQSQEMVLLVDAELGLRQLYSKPERDPWFRLDTDATVEDLVDYWQKMVRVVSDPGTGLIEIEVRAFDPSDAQAVATLVMRESGNMINQLSAIAREDVTRYARDELATAVEQLKLARQALTLFRNEKQIVDPAASLQGQMGVLNSLQGQLAEALIEQDLLLDTTREGDPRIIQARRRIEVIQRRIAEELAKLGNGQDSEGEAFADLVGDFEGLQVDLKFAEESYLSARASLDTAMADARRQNRYLAAYVRPTLAQTPQYPQRALLFILTAIGSFGVWALAVLVFYSLRDRR